METIKNVATAPVKTLRLPEELDAFFQPSARMEIYQEQNEEKADEVENSPVKVKPNSVKQRALLEKKVKNSEKLMGYESLLENSLISMDERSKMVQKRMALVEEDNLIDKQLKRLKQKAQSQDKHRKMVIRVNFLIIIL